MLAIKQISKPLANSIKTRAKSSPFFRTYICMPPAQFYHWCDVNIKMRLMNVNKPREVVKLNEAMAIDLGAELLGEFIIFFIASATLMGERRNCSIGVELGNLVVWSLTDHGLVVSDSLPTGFTSH